LHFLLGCLQVEEVVEQEKGLDDFQKTLIRTAAYDSYDMLVLADEFVNQVRDGRLVMITNIQMQNMLP
jgi:hypothetical protein